MIFWNKKNKQKIKIEAVEWCGLRGIVDISSGVVIPAHDVNKNPWFLFYLRFKNQSNIFNGHWPVRECFIVYDGRSSYKYVDGRLVKDVDIGLNLSIKYNMDTVLSKHFNGALKKKERGWVG